MFDQFAGALGSPELGGVLPVIVGAGLLAIVAFAIVGAIRGVMSGDGHFGIIEAYVGFVRHGKTMLAVQDCIAQARALGALLVSNIAIVAEGVETELIAITDDGLDLDRLMVLALQCRENGRTLVLLIDEAGIVMPARQWQTFPVGLMWLLQQSGKLKVAIRYTTQHPVFVDSILRSLTAVVHNVRATPPPSIRRRIQGKRPWWFQVTTTIPGDFGTEQREKVMWSRKIRYRRAWEGSYDTDAAVLPAGRLKGAAEFLERLERARLEGTSSAEAVDELDLDPQLRATIDQLPQAERGRLLLAIATAKGPAPVSTGAAASGGWQ